MCRYREKRKRRTFEKTIRYESRKAYAEVHCLLYCCQCCWSCCTDGQHIRPLSVAACFRLLSTVRNWLEGLTLDV